MLTLSEAKFIHLPSTGLALLSEVACHDFLEPQRCVERKVRDHVKRPQHTIVQTSATNTTKQPI